MTFYGRSDDLVIFFPQEGLGTCASFSSEDTPFQRFYRGSTPRIKGRVFPVGGLQEALGSFSFHKSTQHSNTKF